MTTTTLTVSARNLRSSSPTVTLDNTTSSTTKTTNATTTSSTTTTTTKQARVRFDAECILIPDALPAGKRPKLGTKSYSLPLWRKARDREGEEDESHVVLKVNLPSFKSKKSSHSRERDYRNASRSPPTVTPHIPSCLRAVSNDHPLPPLPAQEHLPLTALITVYPSAPSAPPNAAAPITVPIRACCAECSIHADAPTEEFSRGAMRVRRRGMGFGVGSFGSPIENMPFTPLTPTSAIETPEESLASATGLTNVNRLVAEMEERKRRSRSATPSPVGTPTSPNFPQAGRTSPSLLGPALVRVADRRAPYGDYLSAQSAEALVPHASSSTDALVHADTQGRGSPLLPLGIAVDEVDKERRRRSVDVARHSAGVVVLGEEEEEDWAIRKASSSKRNSPSASPRKRPPPLAKGYDDDEADLFPLPSASSKSSTPLGTPRHSPRSSPAGSDSSVNLLPRSASDSGTGGSPLLRDALANSKYGHRRTASGGSAIGDASRERSRSEAVCVALGGAGKREREKLQQKRESLTTPIPTPMHDREGSNASQSSLSSSTSASISPLQSHKMAKCERGLLLPPGDERDVNEERGRGDVASLSSNTSRSSSRDSRCSDSDSNADKTLPALPPLATSVLAAGPYSPALAPRLPVYGSLAIPGESDSEPATIDEAEEEDPETIGRAAGIRLSGSESGDPSSSPDLGRHTKRASLHLRIASAPPATTSAIIAPVSTSSSSSPVTAKIPLSTPEGTSSGASTPKAVTRNGRSKSASASATLTIAKSSTSTATTSTSTATATAPPASPTIRRTASLARIRSRSTSTSTASSVGKSTGRKAFGALVDVLRGVASVGAGGVSSGSTAMAV